jgi:septal ring factor EnvC (AmiA/AmiB activator)
MLTFVLESGRATDVIHCGTIEGTSLYLNLARLCKESEELRHERDGARTERDGLSAALAGESRRVADLDRAVNQTGWQKHVLEQEIAAMKRSRFWKAREAWFRVTGREAKAL